MDYSERAITGRVQAAAKLVLQDLDPEAKKRRQEFMSGKFLTRFYAPRIHGHGRTLTQTGSVQHLEYSDRFCSLDERPKLDIFVRKVLFYISN